MVLQSKILVAAEKIKYLWIPVFYFYIADAVPLFELVIFIFIFSISLINQRKSGTKNEKSIIKPIFLLMIELLLMSRVFHLILTANSGSQGEVIFVLSLVLLFFTSVRIKSNLLYKWYLVSIIIIVITTLLIFSGVSVTKYAVTTDLTLLLPLIATIFLLLLRPGSNNQPGVLLIKTVGGIINSALAIFVFTQLDIEFITFKWSGGENSTIYLLSTLAGCIALFFISLNELITREIIPETKRILAPFLEGGSNNKIQLTERLTLLAVLIFILVFGSINMEQLGVRIDTILIFYVVLLFINRYSCLIRNISLRTDQEVTRSVEAKKH
ncbi:MAG: hypothetical protein SCALA702_32310 [Melioribacteraceae bacterium]|nr:MAG: hypothetical protein SCALA702_32310 [Melioribacteraceae bacterium]